MQKVAQGVMVGSFVGDSAEQVHYLRRLLQAGEREACRVGLTIEEAQDTVMELLLQVLSRENVMADVVYLESWFRRAARNAAINHYHRRERRREVCLDLALAHEEAAEDPANQVLRLAWWNRFDQCLKSLPTDWHTVFCRCCLEGETVSDVADSLGKTPGAVSLILHKTRRRLCLLLEQEAASQK
jgi:RNA polymerase sigma factor (sigma-70 family)